MDLLRSRTLVICEAFTGGRSCRNHHYLRRVILTVRTWILSPNSLAAFGQEILSVGMNVTLHFTTSVMVNLLKFLIPLAWIFLMMAVALLSLI
jgi:hypothetical protein